MNKKKLSLKEEAEFAFSRGEWRKALDRFQTYCAQKPEDLRSRLKVAELLERLDQVEEALQSYRRLAEIYAQDGFLLHAISINKRILRINPSSEDVSARLAQLYTEKVRETKPMEPFQPLPLFSEFNQEELHSLLGHIRAENVPKGVPVCREGEEGESLYVIVRGEVAITKRMGQKELWVCNLVEGDFFGEFGFFTDQKRHATATAATDCEILQLSRGDLEKMAETHPRVMEVLQKFFRIRVLDLFLALSPLFSSLTVSEREEVLKRFRIRRVPMKTLLFNEGDSPDSLFMVKNGEVEIFTQNARGKKVPLSTLKSGNLFGEISLLFQRPRMASAKTTRPSELLELTQEDLDACLSRFPNLRSALERISLKRLARTQEILLQEEVERAREVMV